MKNQLHTRLVRPSFGAMGKTCTIQSRMRCSNPKDILLGDRVFIGADAWIDCFRGYAGEIFSPRLEIGDDVTIGYHSHIMVIEPAAAQPKHASSLNCGTITTWH